MFLACWLSPLALSYCTRYKGALPRPELTLTVTVTYDHCSGIGNGVFSQGAIPPLSPRSQRPMAQRHPVATMVDSAPTPTSTPTPATTATATPIPIHTPTHTPAPTSTPTPTPIYTPTPTPTCTCTCTRTPTPRHGSLRRAPLDDLTCTSAH